MRNFWGLAAAFSIFLAGVAFFTHEPYSDIIGIISSLVGLSLVFYYFFSPKEKTQVSKNLTDKQKCDAAEKYLKNQIAACRRLKNAKNLNFKMTHDFYEATIKGANYCFNPEHANEFLVQLMNPPNEPKTKDRTIKLEILNGAPGEFHILWVPAGDLKTLLDYYEETITAWMKQLEPNWFREEFRDVKYLKRCV